MNSNDRSSNDELVLMLLSTNLFSLETSQLQSYSLLVGSITGVRACLNVDTDTEANVDEDAEADIDASENSVVSKEKQNQRSWRSIENSKCARISNKIKSSSDVACFDVNSDHHSNEARLSSDGDDEAFDNANDGNIMSSDNEIETISGDKKQSSSRSSENYAPPRKLRKQILMETSSSTQGMSTSLRTTRSRVDRLT